MATTQRPLPPAFAAVLAPIQAFFRLEAASGILLIVSAVLAMVLANSGLSDAYFGLVEYPLGLSAGGADARFSFHYLVNDGLMAIFFLVVGLEIKRELVVGELRTVNRAMLPLIAAVGGMVVPAGIYVALNAGTPALKGWAIPMATDIAFSIGILTLLKARIGTPIIVFLTALAIFDDIGGILVIAFFYGGELHVSSLLLALAVTGLLFVFNRLNVRQPLPWILGGVALWYLLHHGGIHATIAGVVLGMMIPARALRPSGDVIRDLRAHASELLKTPVDENLGNEQILRIEETLEDLEPPLNRFLHALHPYSSYVIVPVFALVNSGVSLEGMALSDLLAPLPLGIALGLFVGKQAGVFLFTWAAVKAKVSPMPGDAPARHLHGVAVVSGIGFTVALFIASLAFAGEPQLLSQAKLGILVGSGLSALVGYALLRIAPARPNHAPAIP